MKKRREKLHLHYRQAFDYWINCVPSRPRYMVLCNFDEFSIYDFDKQIDEPVDHVQLDQLPLRYPALNFLFPKERVPQFNNDREDVSRRAADKMAELYKRLTERPKRPVSQESAQRFVLQTVVSMFAEDIDLLPAGTVGSIVDDCLNRGQSSYDLFNGLFSQMNSRNAARGGRYEGVRYFNGGLFRKVDPIELSKQDLLLIGGEDGAASENWSKVNPSIFGTLFQDSMDKRKRHALGAHFTSEADIQRIVGPTIVGPWQERIEGATDPLALLAARKALMKYRVLDPACGSGNFLYVAFRELARLDILLMTRLRSMLTGKQFAAQSKLLNAISPKQFYGLDIDRFGVELTKVTLMLAKKLALDESLQFLDKEAQGELQLADDAALPLDNMDDNITCADALFEPWPESDVVVGNPPFQSKNKAQAELSPDYLRRVREAYPSIDGRADYCVHWFRLAHDHLKPGQRAGLVGTNTIRQNYSREAGLDYIINARGRIYNAVSSMVWPGEANIHVSIVNWIKGDNSEPVQLYMQRGNKPDEGWSRASFKKISSSLSFEYDVTDAKTLSVNSRRGGCYQGQTHGNKGFLVSPEEAKELIRESRRNAQILKPYMIAEDLIGSTGAKPSRFAIDFTGLDLPTVKSYPKLYKLLFENVLPTRRLAAAEEKKRNKALGSSRQGNRHHERFLERWWEFSYPRAEMMKRLDDLPRYIVCGCVTLRPIFEFVSKEISPNAALQVFPYADDYSMGILQSDAHWKWFTNRCSTLTERFRYTSNTVFDSFPWPQTSSVRLVRAVADAAVALREERRRLRERHGYSLRETYRLLEEPGKMKLKDLNADLTRAVLNAYGFAKNTDLLQSLLELNHSLSANELSGLPVSGPGLPSFVNDADSFVSSDMVRA